MSADGLAGALAEFGLIARGGFRFAEAEEAPPGPGGRPAKSVILIGNAGSALWRHFSQWRPRQSAGLENPLDAWSREVVGGVAARFAARAVFPFERPYLPFQRWAMRAEGLRPSPLGILMHPEYGLWHAYRGALLFDVEISFEAAGGIIHPCDLCVARPCLNACPANAYSESGFAHKACLSHVRSAYGAGCRDTGCLARNACPHGVSHRYSREHQMFHMAAYAGGSPAFLSPSTKCSQSEGSL